MHMDATNDGPVRDEDRGKEELCVSDPAKLDGIRKWPRILKDKKDVQRTMGILQYNKSLCTRGSLIWPRPIFETIKKGTKIPVDQDSRASPWIGSSI